MSTGGAVELRFVGAERRPEFKSSAGKTFTVSSTGALTLDVWTHVAASYDSVSNEVLVYIDGVEDGDGTAVGAGPVTFGANLSIGSRDAAFYLPGSLFDARIYARVLTPTEIATLADWDTLGDVDLLTDASLLGHYDLQGNEYDRSGNGHHLTLTGTAGTMRATDSTVKYSFPNTFGYSAGIDKHDTWEKGSDSGTITLSPSSITLANSPNGAYVKYFIGATTLDTVTLEFDYSGFSVTNGAHVSDDLKIKFSDHSSGGPVATIEKEAASSGHISVTASPVTDDGYIAFLVSVITGGASLSIVIKNLSVKINGVPFEGVLVPRDDSDTANDVLGSPLDYDGRAPYDGALGGLPHITFNGSDEYASRASSILSAPASGFTLSFWMNYTANGTLFADGYDDDRAIRLDVRNDRFRMYVYPDGLNSSLVYTESAVVVTASELAHWVVTHNGSTEWKVYKDGVLVDTVADTNVPYTGAGLFSIGGLPWGNRVAGSLFACGVYASVLDAADIATLAAHGKPTVDAEAFWPCSERDGTTLFDATGNGNDLTINTSAIATVRGGTNTINDHNIVYGARKSSTVYIPGQLSTALAADGNALTVGPGQLPDDGTFVNRKPAAYPALLRVEDAIDLLNANEEATDEVATPNLATVEWEASAEQYTTEAADPITTESGGSCLSRRRRNRSLCPKDTGGIIWQHSVTYLRPTASASTVAAAWFPRPMARSRW